MLTTRAGPQESHRGATGLRRLPGILDGTGVTARREGRLSAVCLRGMQGCSEQVQCRSAALLSPRSSPGRLDSLRACPHGLGGLPAACRDSLTGGQDRHDSGEPLQAPSRRLSAAGLHRPCAVGSPFEGGLGSG